MGAADSITAENLRLKAKVEILNEQVAVLMTQIAWLKKQMFGAGKGEKIDPGRLELKLTELGALLVSSREADAKLVQYERREKAREKRPVPAETFAHLPVRETVEILPDEVKAEPEAYEKIGEEKTFEVDVTPPKLFKRELVRAQRRVQGRRRAFRQSRRVRRRRGGIGVRERLADESHGGEFFDNGVDLFGLEGFLHEIVAAGVEHFADLLVVGLGGDGDDAVVFSSGPGAELAGEFVAVHHGHTPVEKDEVGRPFGDDFEGDGAVLGFAQREAELAEDFFQQEAVLGLVVHNQSSTIRIRQSAAPGASMIFAESVGASRAEAFAAGSQTMSKRKVELPPGVLVTAISPPMSSI